jgi:hypothetical protein
MAMLNNQMVLGATLDELPVAYAAPEDRWANVGQVPRPKKMGMATRSTDPQGEKTKREIPYGYLT